MLELHIIYLVLCKEGPGEISVALHVVHSSFTIAELLSQLKTFESIGLVFFFLSYLYTMPCKKRPPLNVGWFNYLLKLNTINILKMQLKGILIILVSLFFSLDTLGY